jgi:O-acetyl-ADP-ribose deacetylase (regulator of RNase III)
MIHFHFVNTNYDALQDYRRVLDNGAMKNAQVHFHHADLADIAPACDTFVSASNSRLFFDGGSDLVYMRLFSNIGRVMNQHLRRVWDRHPFTKKCTVPHLPVGAALAVVLPLASNSLQLRTFIAAPTCILPQTVKTTRNAYHAFKMVLELIEKLPQQHDRHVLMPGLANGIGGMDSAVSAAQILEAWRNHMQGDRFDVLPHESCVAYNPAVMGTQPRYHMNTMYFDFETTAAGVAEAHRRI